MFTLIPLVGGGLLPFGYQVCCWKEERRENGRPPLSLVKTFIFVPKKFSTLPFCYFDSTEYLVPRQ
jgi:hypothetical protein